MLPKRPAMSSIWLVANRRFARIRAKRMFYGTVTDVVFDGALSAPEESTVVT